jgi:hypothetical protein
MPRISDNIYVCPHCGDRRLIPVEGTILLTFLCGMCEEKFSFDELYSHWDTRRWLRFWDEIEGDDEL